MSAVALVGLGRMGRSMCARLMGCGFQVTATDTQPDLAEEARRLGARWAPSAAQAASEAAFVVSSLPGPEEVAAVAAELDRVLEQTGACWVEMSTAVPATAAAFADHVIVVDAPVAGSPSEAATGRLLAFAGGSEEAVRRARPVLDVLCERVLHVGPPGGGYAVKLLVNALWFTHAAATAEVVALGERLGLEPRIVAEALGAGPAGSRFVERDLPRLLNGDTIPDFDLAGCCRELDDVLALAAAQGVHAPTIDATAQLHREALAHYGPVNGELLGARYALEGRSQPRNDRSRAWRSSASATSRSSSSS